MRALLAATLIVLLLIGSWMIFFTYSEQNLQEYVNDIEETILPLVENETWKEAYQQMEQLNKPKYVPMCLPDKALETIVSG